MTKVSYSGYRFPPEIIHQASWLPLRFTLSFRDVEDLLAERGILVELGGGHLSCAESGPTGSGKEQPEWPETRHSAVPGLGPVHHVCYARLAAWPERLVLLA